MTILKESSCIHTCLLLVISRRYCPWEKVTSQLPQNDFCPSTPKRHCLQTSNNNIPHRKVSHRHRNFWNFYRWVHWEFQAFIVLLLFLSKYVTMTSIWDRHFSLVRTKKKKNHNQASPCHHQWSKIAQATHEQSKLEMTHCLKFHARFGRTAIVCTHTHTQAHTVWEADGTVISVRTSFSSEANADLTKQWCTRMCSALHDERSLGLHLEFKQKTFHVRGK